MNYFMDLSPTKIRECTVSTEMKEGHAERFLQAISKRKKISPLRKRLFTPPVVKAPKFGRAGVYALPSKLSSSQAVAAATRRHSTSLGCRTLTCKNGGGTRKKVYKCATVIHQNRVTDGVPCPYKVIWRAKEAAALSCEKYDWHLDRTNSIFHHKPMCGSGTSTLCMPTHVPTCPNVPPCAQTCPTCPHVPKHVQRAQTCPT